MSIAQAVEILTDHAAVVQHGTVVRDERRNFAERIVGNERAVAIDGMSRSRHEFQPLAQAQLVGAHQALADKGRRGSIKEFHRHLAPNRRIAAPAIVYRNTALASNPVSGQTGRSMRLGVAGPENTL